MALQTADVRRWLATRHALLSEAAVVLGLYGVYECARGVVAGDAGAADRHALRVVALERRLHLFVEANVQHAARALPDLVGALGVAYLTLHLAVTATVLVWLHRRRPAAFPFVRTALLLASGLSLVGFLAYPTAPPRLAGIGIADTLSNGHVGIDKGLISSLYNPYAAVPSMHIGYALIVAASLLLYCRSTLMRVAGACYPVFVLFEVVATGNHFFVDAAAGAVVAAVAVAVAVPLTHVTWRSPRPGLVRRRGDCGAREESLRKGFAVGGRPECATDPLR